MSSLTEHFSQFGVLRIIIKKKFQRQMCYEYCQQHLS